MSAKIIAAASSTVLATWLVCRRRRKSVDVVGSLLGIALVAGATATLLKAGKPSTEVPLKPENQGEGDRESARRYNKGAEEFVARDQSAH